MNSIEPLEARIAPAAVLTFTDIDGDSVTIKTSLGTNDQLTAATTFSAGALGKQLDQINLTDLAFQGTTLSITAKPGPTGGDGLVNIRSINATGRDLGAVTIDGDLQELDAGSGTATSKVGPISVFSTSGTLVWEIAADVPSLTIKTDLRGAEIRMENSTSDLGALLVGGSIIGEPVVTRSGYLTVGGTIGSIKIGGDLVGSTGARSGYIEADDIGSVTIRGSIIAVAGNAVDTAQIHASESLGPVKIGGSIIGGGGLRNGAITSGGSIGDVTIAGSLVGGLGSGSGTIAANDGLGKIKIGRDIQGGGADSGFITGKALGGLRVGGSIVGGPGENSGGLKIDVPTSLAASTTIGPIFIGGDLQGTVAGTGNIQVVSGVGGDQFALKKITSFTVGGSIIGAAGESGAVRLEGDIGAVKVGGDVRGGQAVNSGIFSQVGKAASLFIGGNIAGGMLDNSGAVNISEGIGKATIGGSILGGGGALAGRLTAGGGAIGSIRIGGDIIGGASFGAGQLSAQSLGSAMVKGSLIGSTGNAMPLVTAGTVNPDSGPTISIGALSVGGRVENAQIVAGGGNPDAQIGSVKVTGDWIASSLAAGVNPTNGKYGDANDVKFASAMDDPARFSKIASIVIGGQVRGTTGTMDSFGFVAQEIGAFKVAGVAAKLTAGRGNDTALTATSKLSIGAMRDVFIHEVPA